MSFLRENLIISAEILQYVQRILLERENISGKGRKTAAFLMKYVAERQE